MGLLVAFSTIWSIMTYRTTQQPLTFWKRVVARLNDDFQRKHELLTAMLLPSRTTIESFNTAQARTAADRDGVLALLGFLEDNRVIATSINEAVVRAVVANEIEIKTGKVEAMTELIKVYEQVANQEKSRLRYDEDVLAAQARYTALLNAGNSEYANAERQRLRTAELPVFAMGREDVQSVRAQLNFLTSLRDESQAEIDKLQHSVKIDIQVKAQFIYVIEDLGIEFVKLDEDPAPQAPAPVQEPTAQAADAADVQSAAEPISVVAPEPTAKEPQIAPELTPQAEVVAAAAVGAAATVLAQEVSATDVVQAEAQNEAALHSVIEQYVREEGATQPPTYEPEPAPAPDLPYFSQEELPSAPTYVPRGTVPLELELLPDEFEMALAEPVVRPNPAGQNWG